MIVLYRMLKISRKFSSNSHLDLSIAIRIHSLSILKIKFHKIIFVGLIIIWIVFEIIISSHVGILLALWKLIVIVCSTLVRKVILLIIRFPLLITVHIFINITVLNISEVLFWLEIFFLSIWFLDTFLLFIFYFCLVINFIDRVFFVN